MSKATREGVKIFKAAYQFGVNTNPRIERLAHHRDFINEKFTLASATGLGSLVTGIGIPVGIWYTIKQDTPLSRPLNQPHMPVPVWEDTKTPIMWDNAANMLHKDIQFTEYFTKVASERSPHETLAARVAEWKDINQRVEDRRNLASYNIQPARNALAEDEELSAYDKLSVKSQLPSEIRAKMASIESTMTPEGLEQAKYLPTPHEFGKPKAFFHRIMKLEDPQVGRPIPDSHWARNRARGRKKKIGRERHVRPQGMDTEDDDPDFYLEDKIMQFTKHRGMRAARKKPIPAEAGNSRRAGSYGKSYDLASRVDIGKASDML